MSQNRKNNKNPRRRNEAKSNRRVDPVEVVIGSTLLSHTTVVTANAQLVLELKPENFGTRLLAIADLYRLFRFRRVWCDVCQTLSAGEDMVALAFASGQVTAPQTLIAMSEMDNFMLVPLGSTVPVRWELSRGELAGIVPWYETVSAAAEPLLDTQGSIVIASANTFVSTAQTFGIVWHYEVEFADRLPAAVSFERFRLMLENDENAGPNPTEPGSKPAGPGGVVSATSQSARRGLIPVRR